MNPIRRAHQEVHSQSRAKSAPGYIAQTRRKAILHRSSPARTPPLYPRVQPPRPPQLHQAMGRREGRPPRRITHSLERRRRRRDRLQRAPSGRTPPLHPQAQLRPGREASLHPEASLRQQAGLWQQAQLRQRSPRLPPRQRIGRCPSPAQDLFRARKLRPQARRLRRKVLRPW